MLPCQDGTGSKSKSLATICSARGDRGGSPSPSEAWGASADRAAERRRRGHARDFERACRLARWSTSSSTTSPPTTPPRSCAGCAAIRASSSTLRQPVLLAERGRDVLLAAPRRRLKRGLFRWIVELPPPSTASSTSTTPSPGRSSGPPTPTCPRQGHTWDSGVGVSALAPTPGDAPAPSAASAVDLSSPRLSPPPAPPVTQASRSSPAGRNACAPASARSTSSPFICCKRSRRSCAFRPRSRSGPARTSWPLPLSPPARRARARSPGQRREQASGTGFTAAEPPSVPVPDAGYAPAAAPDRCCRPRPP